MSIDCDVVKFLSTNLFILLMRERLNSPLQTAYADGRQLECFAEIGAEIVHRKIFLGY